MKQEPKLVVVAGPNQGETRRLDQSGLSIGRHELSDWRLDDDTVSRRQCKIKNQGGRFLLLDYKSCNGTLVNGAPVQQRILQHGDKIRFGRTELLFVDQPPDEPSSCHLEPPCTSAEGGKVSSAPDSLTLASDRPNKMAGLAMGLALAPRIAPTVPARTTARRTGFFTHVCKALSRPKRTVLAFMALAIAGAFAVQLVAPKLYEATALVRVERYSTTAAAAQASGQLPAADDMDRVIATEIETSQSDPVLRPVVERFKLLAVEQQLRGLNVEEAQQRSKAAIRLKRLQVTRSPNSNTIRITYRASDPQLAANAANAVAQSLIDYAHEAAKRSFDQIATVVTQNMPDLVVKMDTSAESLAEFERQLNMADPEQRVSLLAARVTELNTQLAVVQNERIRREAIVKQVNASATIASAQTASPDNSLYEALLRLNAARQQFALARSYYGQRHPEYTKAKQQVQEIEAQVRELQLNAKNRSQAEYREAQSQEARLSGLLQQTKAELEKLQASAHQYEHLKSEAESDKENYNRLAAQARAEAIDHQIHSVVLQITAPALATQEPVFPNLPINLILAIVGAGILGVAVTVFGKTLDPTFYGPDKIKSKFKLDVLASLPKIRGLQYILTPKDMALRGSAASAEDTTQFEEGLRTLRSALMLITSNRPLRSVMVTSATPGEGKSTAAAHLAVTCAQAGQRVLLIDANLRRPILHDMFGIGNGPGLSEILKGERSYAEGIFGTREQGVFLMPAGRVSRRAADLIGVGLPIILAKVSRVFDLVIVDAPAVLGASESLPMAGAADGALLLTKAGVTTEQAVAEAMSNLSRAHANVLGLVMNQVENLKAPAIESYQYPEATGIYNSRRLRAALAEISR